MTPIIQDSLAKTAESIEHAGNMQDRLLDEMLLNPKKKKQCIRLLKKVTKVREELRAIENETAQKIEEILAGNF